MAEYVGGENVKITINDGEMIVSGSGAMASFSTGDSFFFDDYVRRVEFTELVEDVADYFLQYGSTIETVKLNDAVEAIGRYSFYNCSALDTMIFPKMVQEIKEHAFDGCESLKVLKFKGAPPSVGENAFNGVVLNAIFVSEDYVDLYKEDEYWSEFADIIVGIGERLVIPSGVRKIGIELFDGEEVIEEVVLDSELVRIEANAFRGLINHTMPFFIPAGVVEIGDGAFENCALGWLYMTSANPPSLSLTAFKGADNLCKIKVPKRCSALYKNAIGWRNFVNIIEEY